VNKLIFNTFNYGNLQLTVSKLQLPVKTFVTMHVEGMFFIIQGCEATWTSPWMWHHDMSYELLLLWSGVWTNGV